MYILTKAAILLCIGLVSANPPLHLMARVWLDEGKNCTDIDKDFWKLEHDIVAHTLKETSYDRKNCGCTKSMSICSNHIRTQLTLSFQLNSTSFDRTILNRPFNSTRGLKLPDDKASFFVCGEVYELSTIKLGDSKCNNTTTNGNVFRQQSTSSEQPSSGPSIGTIVGASLGALALLAGLATIYPVYRRLKRQARVDSDNDITPIVPGNFGITDAPNSVAPAGV